MVDSGRLWKKVGGLLMFMGEYHHNIDEKGRIVIPTKFRELLENNFIVTKGIEKCLYVYAKKDWDKLVNELNTLPFTKKDARTFIRSFFSGATECELDRQGRTCLASPLISHAGLTKECVIIGANDRIEIWDEQAWNEFLNDNEEKLSDIAENLFGSVS